MNRRLLICSDLDRTLIPNGPQPESPGARRHFAALAGRPEVILTYVTGRHRALVEEAIAHFRLPVPDFVIGDVGTTIYRVGPEHEWSRQQEWEDRIAQDWAGLTGLRLAGLLRGVNALRMQERAKQNRHKLSYYLPVDEDTESLEAEIRQRLLPAGIQARLVWSIDDATEVGLLDILPESASKRHAMEALMAQLDIGIEQTVFCGDSGNDLEVLVSPIPAVLVANCRPDVRQSARRQAAESGTEAALYVAVGGFEGLNGNYSAGMLEGIAHYHPSALRWMGFGRNAGAPPA
jgi:sucrose-6F-phosphate phosphohydrolase